MNKQLPPEDPLRPHTFDGIQEYDKALPNWWLFTLYGAIVFAVGYWIYYEKSDKGPDQYQEYEVALVQLEEAVSEAAKMAPEVSDETIVAMSKDSAAVSAGQQHFLANCAACHGTELQGPPAPGMPGVSLVDNEWIHGFQPMQIRQTLVNGVLEKGMPAWGPVLGDKRILELTAFILSKQAADFPASAVEVSSPQAAIAPTVPAAAVQASAAPAQEVTNEILVAMSQDQAIVAAGQTRYSGLCIACHGNELQGPPAPGLPGVSLVDAEWLHGNEPMQIRNTILKGVIEKGMVPWEAVVGQDGANELVAFILSKQP
jgi:cytochrome c oxidase cbb3-type subunit III